MTTVKVIAPATVANLVCGFDILGMALNDPEDEMTLSLNYHLATWLVWRWKRCWKSMENQLGLI
jgi:homoserine kinase